MKKNLMRILSLVLCFALLTGGTAYATDDVVADVAENETAVQQDETSGETADPIYTRISVTVNGDPSTSKGFCWYTKENENTVLEIYKNGEKVDIAPEYSTAYWEGNYMHKAKVTELEPGTAYEFRVGNGETFSEKGSFTTDNKDDIVKFIAIADVQASSLENFEKSDRVVRKGMETMPDADFFVNLGDFTNDSTNAEWDGFYTAMQKEFINATLVPVAGNHDGLGVYHWFDNMFCLDTSESVQNLNGVNYSFDYGNAHFAVVNTNDMMSISISQLKWLKNDLNGTDKDWKIIFMHKSPYTLGKDGKWPDAGYLQYSLTDVADACGVDLVMSGHDHQYIRTKPLKNNKINSDGTIYVLSGTAGTKRYEIRSFLANHFLKTDFIDALTIQKNGYGNYWNGKDWNSQKLTNIGGIFNTIDISGGTLTLKSYVLADSVNEDGSDILTVADTFSITKEQGQNKSTFSGDNTTSKIEYYLGIVPSFMGLAAYSFGIWLPKFLVMVPDLLYVYFNEGTF